MASNMGPLPLQYGSFLRFPPKKIIWGYGVPARNNLERDLGEGSQALCLRSVFLASPSILGNMKIT